MKLHIHNAQKLVRCSNALELKRMAGQHNREVEANAQTQTTAFEISVSASTRCRPINTKRHHNVIPRSIANGIRNDKRDTWNIRIDTLDIDAMIR